MTLTLLLALASAAQQPAEPPAPPPAEKRICKKTVDTGSLVRGRKECRTRAEWDKISWAARQNGEDIVQRNAGQPFGN